MRKVCVCIPRNQHTQSLKKVNRLSGYIHCIHWILRGNECVCPSHPLIPEKAIKNQNLYGSSCNASIFLKQTFKKKRKLIRQKQTYGGCEITKRMT